MKIAILDDDEKVRISITLLLQTIGHTPKAFSNEQELFSGVKEFCPEMVILDQMLGGQRTGIQLVQELRSIYPDLPIVIISGYPQAELAKAVKLNQVSFLPKPFSLAALEKQISDCSAT